MEVSSDSPGDSSLTTSPLPMCVGKPSVVRAQEWQTELGGGGTRWEGCVRVGFLKKGFPSAQIDQLSGKVREGGKFIKAKREFHPEEKPQEKQKWAWEWGRG